MEDTGNVSLTLKEISFKTKKKTILDSVDAVFRSSKITAIVGTKDSGATALLSILAGDCKETKGTIHLNGEARERDFIRNISGYVQIDDKYTRTMTIREMIEMAANLKRTEETVQQRKTLTENMLKNLNIEKNQSDMVGLNKKKCSPEEKRLASIGAALIANPKILFLEEPTTGLDRHTSTLVMEQLAQKKNEGVMVVFTTQPPLHNTLEQVDDILVLEEGHVLYFGELSQLKAYLNRNGFETSNDALASFLTEIVPGNKNGKHQEQERKARRDLLKEIWTGSKEKKENKRNEIGTGLEEELPLKRRNKVPSIIEQISFIFKREWLYLTRKPLFLILMAVVLFLYIDVSSGFGWLFSDNNPFNLTAVQYKFFVVLYALTFQLFVIRTVSYQRRICKRETKSLYYRKFIWVIAIYLVYYPLFLVSERVFYIVFSILLQIVSPEEAENFRSTESVHSTAVYYGFAFLNFSMLLSLFITEKTVINSVLLLYFLAPSLYSWIVTILLFFFNKSYLTTTVYLVFNSILDIFFIIYKIDKRLLSTKKKLFNVVLKRKEIGSIVEKSLGSYWADYLPVLLLFSIVLMLSHWSNDCF